MKIELEKLWLAIQLMWLPHEIAVRQGWTDSSIRIIAKIIYLAQWVTKVDLGYRFELCRKTPRIVCHELNADLVNLGRAVHSKTIEPVAEQLSTEEQARLHRFAELLRTIPVLDKTTVEDFVTMIARFHYVKHIAGWGANCAALDFETHYPGSSDQLLVERELFLGRLYELYNELHLPNTATAMSRG